MHAYTYAIENPAEGSELIQGNVTDMGLVVYSPSTFHTPLKPDGAFAGALTGALSYVHVPRDDKSFEKFVKSVLDVLELEEAPPPPPPKRNGWGGNLSSCPHCNYLLEAKKKGFIPD